MSSCNCWGCHLRAMSPDTLVDIGIGRSVNLGDRLPKLTAAIIPYWDVRKYSYGQYVKVRREDYIEACKIIFGD